MSPQIQFPRIPAFINPEAGGAADALKLLRSDTRIDLHETSPDELQDELQDALRAALEDAPPTIVVAGGDGTISSAASLVVGTSTRLCLLRSGTLNHFARRMGVPADPKKALELAFTGETQQVDVGHVNDRLFLNTCLIGLYITFVNSRERLEPKIGYVASSVYAAVATLVAYENRRLDLLLEGIEREYTSLLVFVGVGERDFRMPVLGEPKEDGKRGLHVAITKPLNRARLVMMTARAAVRGVRPWPTDKHVDSFITDRFEATLHDVRAQITLDGEITDVDKNLSFCRQPSALAVCTPPPGKGGRSSNM